MQAKPNTKYAIIANGVVSQIFDDSMYKEWDERSINVIELTSEMEKWCAVGLRANADNTISKPSLNEAKQIHLNILESFFLQEVQELKDSHTTQAEINTYETQLEQAKAYAQSKDESQAPLLAILAQARGVELDTLAQKIIEKNQIYNERLMLLLGNFQNLKDKTLKAKTEEELINIVYESPLASEV